MNIIVLFILGLLSFYLVIYLIKWISFCSQPVGFNNCPTTKIKFKTWKNIFEFNESKWKFTTHYDWVTSKLFYDKDNKLSTFNLHELKKCIQVKMSYIDYIKFCHYVKCKKKRDKLVRENENLLSIVQDTQDAIEKTKEEINGQFEYANHLMREATKNGRK